MGAHPPGCACGLGERKAEPHRRPHPGRGIGPGSHGEAGAGQSENQFIRGLAGGEPRSLAQRVANVAEHDQIADCSARQPRHVGRLAGDQTLREAADRMPGASRRRLRGLDPPGETGVDRHVPIACQGEEARREVGIAGSERGLHLAPGDGCVE
jgi:hypothetical protein